MVKMKKTAAQIDNRTILAELAYQQDMTAEMLHDVTGIRLATIKQLFDARTAKETPITISQLDELAIGLGYNSDPIKLINPEWSKDQKKTRLPMTAEAAAEHRRQKCGKLGGRLSMTVQELEEAAKHLNKTTPEELSVYKEGDCYEIRRGVIDKSEYFVLWQRESMKDHSYLGKFASDEDAINAFQNWRITHRAYGDEPPTTTPIYDEHRDNR